MKVNVVEKILSANDQIAADNRRSFDEKGVFVINLMASGGGQDQPDPAHHRGPAG